MFAAGKVLGKKWYDRPENEKTEMVAFLLDNERDDDRLVQRAVEQWGMTRSQAESALEVDLPAGYGNLSLMALEKLLPYMEGGMLYMADDETNSALHAAGYLRRDQLRRRIFDHLPDPRRVRDCPIGDLPNPVVKRTLTEVRRVVNAIIRKYGKPDAVHVEMAREVQQGKKARTEYSKRIRDREAGRKRAADQLGENQVRLRATISSNTCCGTNRGMSASIRENQSASKSYLAKEVVLKSTTSCPARGPWMILKRTRLFA